MKNQALHEQAEFSFAMKPLKQEAFFVKKPVRPTIIPETPQVMSVTEVTRQILTLLEKNIGAIWIEGEISNYRKQSSGHHYFTLKDAGAQIACVLFARTASALQDPVLSEGMAVQLFGNVTVYQARGQYQLLVQLIQPKGHGLLQAKLEALKAKLSAEGLFDAARKRALPRFVRRIGVVTSPTGAAIADFLTVLHRRHPGLQVVINPVRVQGQGAAAEIAAAITDFSKEKKTMGPIDLIVITRGGGSLEDLWEFNEESVVRAIAASSVPVVSAIGHEIDFTLSDFAADLRAPTPSAAAELIAADAIALLEKANFLLMHLMRAVMNSIERSKNRLFYLEGTSFFRSSGRLLAELQQRKDGIEEKFLRQMRERCDKLSFSLTTMAVHLRSLHPRARLVEARHHFHSYQHRLCDQVNHNKQLLAARVENLRSSMAALNPDATLARGFTITRNEQGQILTSSKKRKQGENLHTQFFDGVVSSTIFKT